MIPVAAAVQLIVWLTPIVVKELQESKVMDEEERTGLLADLFISNSALVKELSTYRPLPPPKKSGKK